MVNQARTLLLNTPAASRPAIGVYGEEFIDPSYQPVSDGSIVSLSGLLFGTNPDAFTQNYHVAQYMRILESVPWSQFLLCRDFDPRITYRAQDNTLLNLNYGSQLVLTSSNFATPGDWYAALDRPWVGNEATGIHQANFTVSFVYGGSTTITRANPVTSFSYSTSSIPVSIPLEPNLPVNFLIKTADSPTGRTGVWSVSVLARPSRSVPQIYAGMQQQLNTLSSMWTALPASVSTFLSGMFTGVLNTDTDRFAAALLTLIYYTQGVQSGR